MNPNSRNELTRLLDQLINESLCVVSQGCAVKLTDKQNEKLYALASEYAMKVKRQVSEE